LKLTNKAALWIYINRHFLTTWYFYTTPVLSLRTPRCFALFASL